MDRLEEAVQICRAMFDADHTSFAGRYCQTDDVRNVPRPIQSRIPIMIGGGGEKRTLKLVATYADACNIGGDEATVAHKIAVLREHCAAIGRDPNEIAVTRFAPIFRTGSADETKSTREMITAMAGEESAAGFDIGTDDEILTRLARLVEAGVDELILVYPFATPADLAAQDTFIAEIRGLRP
jgi:alkanesulfonate monooxygenase SsuD/methylene tetrahydromethanopterin reductase-like flavin-dependent oxidoreductase (luciferase family)